MIAAEAVPVWVVTVVVASSGSVTVGVATDTEVKTRELPVRKENSEAIETTVVTVAVLKLT